MKVPDRLVIRPFRREDEARLIELGQEAEMGTLEGFEETIVACLDDGTIAGFCRMRTLDGIAYVNPVVVDASLREKGIGTMLMHAACDERKELRFVARGYAVPFYQSIDCEEIPWPDIHRAISCDCAECDNFDSCNPVPMRMQENGRQA